MRSDLLKGFLFGAEIAKLLKNVLKAAKPWIGKNKKLCKRGIGYQWIGWSESLKLRYPQVADNFTFAGSNPLRICPFPGSRWPSTGFDCRNGLGYLNRYRLWLQTTPVIMGVSEFGFSRWEESLHINQVPDMVLGFWDNVFARRVLALQKRLCIKNELMC